MSTQTDDDRLRAYLTKRAENRERERRVLEIENFVFDAVMRGADRGLTLDELEAGLVRNLELVREARLKA